MLLHL